MPKKCALIVQGGWQGHQPETVATILADQLHAHDFEVIIADTLDAFVRHDLTTFDLIVPLWTMGVITDEQLQPLLDAVKGGVGLAGLHGGMADAFRDATEYQFMVGGQWVAHPGGDSVRYSVLIDGVPHTITDGIQDFAVVSEQYYMHVDPANTVLATTRFGDTVMPVAWIKHYGKGRVFYFSVGHSPEAIQQPEPLMLMTRGMLWAAGALKE